MRIRRGVRVDAEVWEAASARERFRAHVDAVAATLRQPIFLREAAAVLWDLPLVDPFPPVISIEAQSSAGSRTRNGIAERRSFRPPQLAFIDGYAVSSLAQTVVDLARFATFRSAVTAADHALRLRGPDGSPLLLRADLSALFEQLPPAARGSRQCAAAIEFADPRAESPLESISRCAMKEAGIPAPELQRRIACGGSVYTADFFWPEVDVVGEADGRAKYTDPAYLRGRTAEEAVLDEKRREDDIRSVTKGFARWGWNAAYTVAPMLEELRKAGVRAGAGNVRGSR